MIRGNDLRDIVGLLDVLSELELKVSQFYNACAESYSEEEEFWESLVSCEKLHSCYISRISGFIKEKPEQFEVGRRFNSVAAKTVIKGVDSDIEKVKNNLIDIKKALNIARDIEMSLLEQKFFEIVKSENNEFLNLLDKIVSDTREHKVKIEKKINEYKEK